MLNTLVHKPLIHKASQWVIYIATHAKDGFRKEPPLKLWCSDGFLYQTLNRQYPRNTWKATKAGGMEFRPNPSC